MLSAHNKFKGIIKSIKLGQVMTEVVVAVGNLEVVSLISGTSAQRMSLKVGDEVTTVVKEIEVMIAKE